MFDGFGNWKHAIVITKLDKFKIRAFGFSFHVSIFKNQAICLFVPLKDPTKNLRFF